MDPLTRLLDGPHARRAFALRVVMDPPWSILVQDRAPLTLMAVLAGQAWLAADGERVLLESGDIAVVRGPDPYLLADDPGRAATIIIHPGQECTTPSGETVHLSMSHGVRTWGNASAGETVVLVGTYTTEAEIGSAVTAVLPRVAIIPAGGVDAALARFLGGEITTNAPAQGSVVDRMLDVLLVHAVRAWAAEHPGRATGWLAAGTDSLVAPMLELMHDSPAEAWTLETFAARLHVSRATLASRFRDVVGEPPMTYLTNWRMLLASELLADPNLTTAQVAGQVGYGGPFALSAAFKRRFGLSPTAYRHLKYAPPTPQAV